MYYYKLIEDFRDLFVIITLGLEFSIYSVLFQMNQLNKNFLSFILILYQNS